MSPLPASNSLPVQPVTTTTASATAPAAATASNYLFQKVDFPGDAFTQLLGINGAGQIVGFHGATTAQGITLKIPPVIGGIPNIVTKNDPGLAQTMIVAVSNLGSLAGIAVTTAGVTVGFTDINNNFVTVIAPNTAFNQLLGINDVGQAVGYSSVIPAGNVQQRAYTYAGGAFTYLTLPTNVNSQATGINNGGVVVGFYQPTATTSNGFIQVPAIRRGVGGQTILSVPGSTFTQALGVNNSGQVVGFYNDTAGVAHGFSYAVATGTYTTIDEPNATNTTVNGVNDQGDLAGFYTDANGNTNGFFAVPPAAATKFGFATFNVTNDTFTQLLGINDAGEVVGFHGMTVASGFNFQLPTTAGATATINTENFPNAAQTMVTSVANNGSTGGIYVDTAGTTHGFVNIGGTFTTVDAPKTAFNQILGLNNAGQQVGYSSVIPAGNVQQLAYIHQANGMFNYLTLPTNVNSQAVGIDESGEVVGFFQPTATTSSGFYQDANGKLTILNAPGATSTTANAINNEGQVDGFYVDAAGTTHGFLYTVASGSFLTIDVPGATATTLNGINDLGQVTGFDVDATGNTNGFVGLPPGACTIHNPISSTTYLMPESMTTLTFGGTTAATVVNAHAAGATITANNANNNITMTVQGTANAGSGNNTMTATAAGSTMTAGSGANTMVSNASNTTMTAGNGANTMVLANFTSNNTMTAGNGANQMFAFGSNNTITAGTGANLLLAQITSSTVNLGAGNVFVFGDKNTVNVAAPTSVVSVNGAGETINAGQSASGPLLFFGQGAAYNLASAATTPVAGAITEVFDVGAGAKISAGDGTMAMLATGGGSTITLGAGNQLVGVGGTGNRVTVGAGNSAVFTGAGNATVTFGAGNSTAVVAGAGNTVTFGAGASQVFESKGASNKYLLDAALTSKLDFYGFAFNNTGTSDQLGLTKLLAGTAAKADLTNISSFLSTTFNGNDTLLTATVGGRTGVIATLHGVGQLSLATLVSDNALKI